MRRCVPLAFFGLVALLPSAVLAEEDNKPVSFTKDIAPILAKNCLACHGDKDPMGGYQVSTFALLNKPGDSASAPVTARKLDDSELYRLITVDDPDQRMPKDSDPLPAEQVALIRRWIEQGAKFDGPDAEAALSSYLPKAAQPAAPEKYPVAVPITAVAFHPGGEEVAIGGYHEVTIWKTADGSLARRIGNIAQRTYGLKYNKDGSLLAVAAGTPGVLGQVLLVNPADGSLVNELGTMSDVAYDVAFSPSGDKLAACAADRSIRVWDVASGKQDLLIEDHADWVMAIAFNHNGTQLVSGSRDKTSKVFDVKTGDAVVTYPGHNETVYGVAFSADGKTVFSAGADRKVHAWNVSDAKKAGEMTGFGSEVYELNLEGDLLFACSADKTARLFDAAKRSATRQFTGHADWIYCLAYHAPSKRLVTGSYDGEVRIWNAEDGKTLISFKAAPGLAEAQTK